MVILLDFQKLQFLKIEKRQVVTVEQL